MDFDSLDPQVIATIAVAALLPALWYVIGRPSAVSVVAAINVVVIAGSLWLAMGPHTQTRADASA